MRTVIEHATGRRRSRITWACPICYKSYKKTKKNHNPFCIGGCVMAELVHAESGGRVIANGFTKDELIKSAKFKSLAKMRRKVGQFFKMTTDGVRYAHNRNTRGKLVPAIITLTYPDNSFWEPKQITGFINNMRNYAERKWGLNLRYVWIAEATKKGVIHYHIVVWHPRNKRFPKPDDKGWWPYGLTNIEGVRKGVGKYLQKYMTKGSDLGIDRRGDNGRRLPVRTYAVGGLDKREDELLSHFMIPNDIKRVFGGVPFGTRIRKVKGGWECKNFRSRVKEIGGYFFWGCSDVFIPSNWLQIQSFETKAVYFEYGAFWSELPDEPLKDVWIPF